MAASLLVHVAVLYAADRSDLLQRAERSASIRETLPDSAKRADKAPEPPTCEANAALAAAARIVVCASPIFDRRACVRTTLKNLTLGVTVCNALAMSSEIDLVAPKTVEEIAAEPLLDLLDPAEQAELEQNQIALIEERQTPPPPPPPPPNKRQVVEITKPTQEQIPDNADLVSEYNNKVDKQTVARGSTEEMVEKPPLAELPVKSKPREASIAELPDEPGEKVSKRPDGAVGAGTLMMRKPGESKPAQEAKEKETAGPAIGAKKPPSGSGLDIARGTADAAQDEQKASSGKTGEGGGGGGRPLVPNLIPSKDVLERALGGGSVDHLPDMTQGDTTSLNTRQWRYASFFNRMKRRVAQNWDPSAVYMRRDPHGNVFGTKDRETTLTVTLDAKGKIKALVVSKKSGVDELDEEAVRAFRLAQPFPNPPSGLVDPRSGLITFPFYFHFDVQRRKWRVFRRR